MKKVQVYYWRLLLFAFCACRKEEAAVPPTSTQVTQGVSGPIKGFFLLNEANMGSGKATLDYFDYESGVYSKNIYHTRNQQIDLGLGDVGNDIQIYGSKLYAVINVSHVNWQVSGNKYNPGYQDMVNGNYVAP